MNDLKINLNNLNIKTIRNHQKSCTLSPSILSKSLSKIGNFNINNRFNS